MADPARTVRVAPSGKRLDDGHSTVVTFKNKPGIKLWEKTVTPPGLDCEDPIDTKTMFNTLYRTKAPRALITVPEFTFKCAYAPEAYLEIGNDQTGVINCNDEITIWFPNGDAVYFWGYMKSFIPDEVSEGAQPEATVTIVPTMWDHLNCVEADFIVYLFTGSCWDDCAPGASHTARPGPG
jgi:hypothetical protein